MLDEILDAIFKAIKNFLLSDQEFKFQPYNVLFELGFDGNTTTIPVQGVNLYEIAYETLEGQYAERVTLLIEYYESVNSQPNNTHHPSKIKDRAKRFYNFINARYSKRFIDKDVGNIESVNSLEFFVNDKNLMVGIIQLSVLKRNSDKVDFTTLK